MSRSDPAHLEATVHGRVQGVGYRYFVVAQASALGLTGWVSNEFDGSVRCVAEGPRSDLQQLLEILKEGPASAWIDHVSEDWLPYTGHWSSFGIRSSGHRGD
jgi:acylphosphatase